MYYSGLASGYKSSCCSSSLKSLQPYPGYNVIYRSQPGYSPLSVGRPGQFHSDNLKQFQLTHLQILLPEWLLFFLFLLLTFFTSMMILKRFIYMRIITLCILICQQNFIFCLLFTILIVLFWWSLPSKLKSREQSSPPPLRLHLTINHSHHRTHRRGLNHIPEITSASNSGNSSLYLIERSLLFTLQPTTKSGFSRLALA